MPAADRPVRLACGLSGSGRAVTAAAAEPEPGYGWMANHGQINAALVYGSTETAEDYSFAYPATTNGSRMTVYEDIAGAKVGEKLTIEISVGSAKVAVEGKTSTDEMSGFVFGVAKKFASSPWSPCSRSRAASSKWVR